MVFGEYPLDVYADPYFFFKCGVIRKKDMSNIEEFDPSKIT